MKLVLFVFFPMILLPNQSLGWNLTEYNNVYNAVLSGYNKDARPILDQSKTMNATLDFYLRTIANLDEVSSELVTVGLFTIIWTDEVITWNPGSYGGTVSVNIDESLVWKPSMTLLNPMSTNVGLLGFKQSKIQYFYTGVAYWNIADRYQTTCDFDTTYFPFDKQTCEIKIMAWDYTTQVVMMYPLVPVVNLTYFSENGAWELLSTATRSETLSYYSVVVFSLNLKRRALFFVTNLLIPVFTMLILNTLVFILPPNSGERVGYSITCLLALAVFLTLVSEGLPQVSKPMPVIGYVLTVYLLISALICVETIYILRLHYREENENIASFYVKIYRLFTCSFRTSGNKRTGTVRNFSSNIDLEDIQDPEKSEASPLTWKILASCLDRICFLSNLSIVVLVAIVFFVIVNVKS